MSSGSGKKCSWWIGTTPTEIVYVQVLFDLKWCFTGMRTGGMGMDKHFIPPFGVQDIMKEGRNENWDSF
jgi:hypothetical protein